MYPITPDIVSADLHCSLARGAQRCGATAAHATPAANVSRLFLERQTSFRTSSSRDKKAAWRSQAVTSEGKRDAAVIRRRFAVIAL